MSRALRAKEAPPATLVDAIALPASADHQAAMVEARRLATMAGRAATSVDVLLGMLHAGGAAARLLAERGVTSTAIEILGGKVRPDYGVDPAAIALASQEIALGLSAAQTTSLHLLLALLRGGGAAALTLQSAGVDPAKLRGVVMRILTGPGGLRERRLSRAPASSSLGPSEPGTREILSIVPAQPALAQPVPAQPEPAQPVPAPPTCEESPTVSFGATARAEIELRPVDPPHVPVLYREREVGRLLDLLQAKTARIIAIVGDPGSGRSALLSALAAASLQPPVFPSGDVGAPASAGALLQGLHRAAHAQVPIVLEGAAWLGPEGGDGVLQLLACASAGRRWILCLTPADLRRIELATPDLGNALETVLLAVPEPAMLCEIIETGLDALARESGVAFAADVTPALQRLSARYPCERAQPGRALAIAEIALARAQRMSEADVSARDIAAVVGDASGVPASQLLRDDDDRFRTLEERLADRVVGHVEARTKIASVLRRSYAGFRGRKPLASFLLLGPSGVGKTETARAIAEALFDGESALVRIDLSEYSEAHSIARLIGSPPGYVAHEDGGQLTEAIRKRPAAVVLLDELEKANREVLLLLLQILEDGRLTDGRGRTVDFSSAAVVMTSNLGSECYQRKSTPAASTILALARSRLPPELWNRIDEVFCYAPLCEAELAAVVARLARDSSQRLQAERGISFAIDDSVVAAVLRLETDRSLGARPLRRAFERLVEGPLANEIVAGRLRRGVRLGVACHATGRLQLRVVAQDTL
jgi:ATP-dependent Clp protease ATP-binding subunit ClpC